jgi:hypothetical protein
LKRRAPTKPSRLSRNAYRPSFGGATPRANRISFDAVRTIAVALPEVEEGTTYGSPAFKVCGNLMACLAIHKSAEPDTLAVSVDFDQRADLMATDPDTYYLTDHYLNYPIVLVRLSRIRPGALRELLEASWRFVSAKPPKIRSNLRR